MVDTIPRLTEDIFGASLVRTEGHDGSVVYRVQNGTGTGTMTDYELFRGIHLMFVAFSMAEWIPERHDVPLNAIELNHCRAGRCEVLYDDKLYFVSPKDFCLAAKDVPELSSAFPTGRYEGISIVVSGEAVNPQNAALFRRFGIDIAAFFSRYFQHGTAFVLHGNPTTEHIFSELYTVGHERRADYCRLKMLELLHFLGDEENLRDKTEQKKYSAKKIAEVKEVAHFITKHLDEPFTVAELSARFSIPETTLKSCFSAIYGKPIAAFIRDIRMHRAADLLRTTDFSVMEIASRSGYDNASKFSAAFRSVMQCNPLEWRNGTRN